MRAKQVKFKEGSRNVRNSSIVVVAEGHWRNEYLCMNVYMNVCDTTDCGYMVYGKTG